MARKTGAYVISTVQGEEVRAFVPAPLPPSPRITADSMLSQLLSEATNHCRLLDVASQLVPDKDWFLYGFVRKEALLSSQIEGTQSTLMDVLNAEGDEAEQTADAEEVVNYVRALNFCLKELHRPKGLPLSLRLIREAHKLLMKGVRGQHKMPGEFRRTQNWLGGSRPGNAAFVPPPPEKLGECLNALEAYLNTESSEHPLIKAGLVHVQFETIHPFLDGNGRVGRLLITLLLDQWGVLKSPLLYLSLHFKRLRPEYYDKLSRVRNGGNWEGWLHFFLEGVSSVALEGTKTAEKLFAIAQEARTKVINHEKASVVAIRLTDLLPKNPIVTVQSITESLGVTKPTALKALDLLVSLNVLREITGRERGRKFAFSKYLKELSSDTEPIQ